jgi:hypothetical protein
MFWVSLMLWCDAPQNASRPDAVLKSHVGHLLEPKNRLDASVVLSERCS